MSLKNKVRNSFSWKQSESNCALRLNIPLTRYQEIKEQIKSEESLSLKKSTQPKTMEFEENLDAGTGKYVVLTSNEPRSPEEVEELLKISNSKKWRLSSYYNKQQPNGLWLVTGLVTQKKLEPLNLLENTLKNFNPFYQPVTKPILNTVFTTPTCAVLSIQDLHFGKEGNSDVVSCFKAAVIDLTAKAAASHHLTKIVYVFGGDILNMDTFNGSTTNGTPVDNEMRAQTAYNEAFDAVYWSINYIKQFCETLHMVYLPGNHDRISSYHMAHALSKCFNDSNIIFDVVYAERKVVVFGDNFFAFEHGDVAKKNTPLIYATEFAVQWGLTTHRTCYTGHWHSKKTIEYITDNEVNGFAIKHIPSLCATDYWHYHNKFVGAKRQAIMEIHDAQRGKISEFSYTV